MFHYGVAMRLRHGMSNEMERNDPLINSACYLIPAESLAMFALAKYVREKLSGE
jgi:hypothetical protein